MKKSLAEAVHGLKTRLLVCALVAGSLVLGYAASAQMDEDPVLLSPRGSVVRTLDTNSLPVSLPFYVHNIALRPPPRNFAASGYMGDVSFLRVMGGYTDTLQEGVPCIKVVYMAGGVGGWAGLVWQNPADNWGDRPNGGYNLTYARKIEFWARGERGGEIVEFKIGGAAGEYPDSANVTTGPVTLKKDWMRYVLDLRAADLRYISAGFGFVVTEANNLSGCTFYLDKIGYVE